ncbi:MAG: hypothetical protein ACRENP_13670 [Longimicrobiales bacterium]
MALNAAVQVVARGNAGEFCQVLSWQTIGSDLTAIVECFEAEGARIVVEFRILVLQ